MRFSVFLLVIGQLHFLHAVVLDEAQRWTLRDTENDDGEDSEYASGDESPSEKSWVIYSRGGEVHPATVDDMETFEQYLLTQPDIFTAGPKSRFESYTGEQMEDGPDKLDTIDRVNPRPTAAREESLPFAGTVLDVVASTNFYPEFAVGILENGCTAFLVGPRHALTSAHCVYDSEQGSLKDGMDMWRGRNMASYLDQMLWTDVVIPRRYLLSAAEEDDWAMIVFDHPSTSRVWLKFGFSESIYNVPYTVFGYLSTQNYGVMYSTVCRSESEGSEGEQLLSTQCGSDECFDGGPLLRGYDFKRSKMPVAYGITLSRCTSYSFSHNNIIFQSDLFWSICYLLSEFGFDAQCALKSS